MARRSSGTSTSVRNHNTWTQTLNRVDMPYTSLEDIQRVATATLREAMANERCKRWRQVVRGYRRLLKTLEPENMPKDYETPRWMSMLLYEVYYHLGLALQWAGDYVKAADQYTKALEAVFIPKNGCLAGCNSNSCLMTPLYARRAFAYAQAGNLKGALKDAEKAVVLDSKNSDVYCIRALARTTRKEEPAALHDVQTALKYNPNNLCALIIRGTLVQPLVLDEWGVSSRKENTDHSKHVLGECKREACSINPDCHNYLGVDSFKHPDILTFYERFLYSLSVPHTISTIVLTSGQPTKRPGSASTGVSSVVSGGSVSGSSRSSPSSNPMKIMQHHVWINDRKQAFRCGTPKEFGHAQASQRRRKEYGEAVREHTAKPQTIEDYLANIEKQRVKRAYEMSKHRPQTASAHGSVHSETTSGYCSRTSGSGSTNKMQAFTKVNVTDVPRMYYRPWLGDKLPVEDLERRTWIVPPFKV